MAPAAERDLKMGQSNPNRALRMPPGSRCPICSGSSEVSFRPFCSRRCADVDLSRWLRGAYAIPGGQQDADEDGDDTMARQRGPDDASDVD